MPQGFEGQYYKFQTAFPLYVYRFLLVRVCHVHLDLFSIIKNVRSSQFSELGCLTQTFGNSDKWSFQIPVYAVIKLIADFRANLANH